MVGKLQLIENSFQRLLHSELRSIQKEASRGMTGFLMFICLGNGLTENIKSKFLRTVCGPKLIQMAKLIGNRIGHFRYPSSLDHEENVDGVGFTICAQMLNNFIYCLMQNICVSFIYTGMSFQKTEWEKAIWIANSIWTYNVWHSGRKVNSCKKIHRSR